MKLPWILAYTVFPNPFSSNSWYGVWYELGFLGAYPQRSYQTFDLGSPQVQLLQSDPRCSRDHILLTPHGTKVNPSAPLVLDHEGNLVWTDSTYQNSMNLQIQRYQGEDYLTFWSGAKTEGHGVGSYYMLNSAYEIAYELAAAGNLQGDFHEIRLTDNGTALLTVYEPTQRDLSSLGGPEEGWVLDCLFQEVDVATGALLFQWRASDHFALNDSFVNLGRGGSSPESAFDYFHINSVDKDNAGNYFISSRHFHTVACVNATGDVVWELGGRHNAFADLSDGAATDFSWQHHALWNAREQTLTLYDNGASYLEVTGSASRAMSIGLDLNRMTAKLIASYQHPRGYLSPSQGSFQMIMGSETQNHEVKRDRPELNGNETDPRSLHAFVGYGQMPAFTEFAADGQVLCDATFGSLAYIKLGWAQSYRVMRGVWVGRPKTAPTIKLDHGFFESNVYVSWNGATEVRAWRLEGCESYIKESDKDGRDCEPIDEVAKDGFETNIVLPADPGPYLRVVALDAHHKELGRSAMIRTDTGRSVNVIGDFEDDEDDDDDTHSTFTEKLFVWTCLSLIGYAVYRRRRHLHALSQSLSGYLYAKTVGRNKS